jgi:hypothetical protein
VLAMAGIALASSIASAAVIYQGNFTGTGGMGSLNGTSVTVGPNASNYVSGSLSSTWLATSSSSYGWSDSGYFNDSANNPGRATAQLNFTPLSGDIYTLSATVSLTNGANTAAYLSIGFLSNANSSNLTAGWDNLNVTSGEVSASPWVLVTWEDDSGTIYTGPGREINGIGFSTGQSGALTNDSFSLVLNTTGANTSNSPWTYQVYNNNTLVSGSTPIDLPAGTVINEVGMQAASATGTVSSFELATVPEPATLGLVAVGGLGLLLLKRRKAV